MPTIFCPPCDRETTAARLYGPLGTRLRSRGDVFRWVNVCGRCGARYTTIAPIDEKGAARYARRVGQLSLFTAAAASAASRASGT